MNKKIIAASGFALVLMLGGCGKSNDNAKSNAGGSAKSNVKAEPAAGTQSATPPAPPATVAVARSGKGELLVDANGMTLYRFDKDKSSVSNCAGACGQTWPPLLLQAGTAAPVTGNGVQGPPVRRRAVRRGAAGRRQRAAPLPLRG